MYIPLFGSLSGRKWNDQERMLIPPFSLKTSNFCSPKNWEEWEGMDLGLMKFLLKSLKYPFNISPFFSFSHKKIQLSFLHNIIRPLQSEAAGLSFSIVCCKTLFLLTSSCLNEFLDCCSAFYVFATISRKVLSMCMVEKHTLSSVIVLPHSCSSFSSPTNILVA